MEELTNMFSKEEVEAIVKELRDQWGEKPKDDHNDDPHAPVVLSNWEHLLRDVYVGMARADGGVALGDLDPRVIEVIQKYQKKSAQPA
jgi:hypothetical protein